MCNFISDSSFIVALIDEKDLWHKKAKYIITRLKTIEHTEIILDCVVNEVISVLAKRIEKRHDYNFIEILEKLEKKIPKNKIVWAYPRIIEFYEQILDIIKKYEGALNFHDAMIVTVMNNADLKYIISFDQDFDLVDGIERIYHTTVDNIIMKIKR